MSKRPWPRRFNEERNGFSLIELMIAVVIFAFLVIGILSTTSVQISSNSYLQHHSKLLQLAEDGIEFLNRVDYNTQLAGYNHVVETNIPNYIGFQREFTVLWDTDISRMSVRVFWRKNGINSKPIVLNSIRTR